MMKFPLLLTIFTVQIFICTTSSTVVERLNAVVARLSTTKILYPRTRRANDFYHAYTAPKQEENLDPQAKNRICLSIMGSSEYTTMGATPVDMYDPRISEELKLKYRHIFERLYEPTNSGSAEGNNDDDDLIYTNRTIPMHVFVSADETIFTENVFICLSNWKWASEGRQFKEYFVSEEYNMNNATDMCNKHIAGRFVFVSMDTVANMKIKRPHKEVASMQSKIETSPAVDAKTVTGVSALPETDEIGNTNSSPSKHGRISKRAARRGGNDEIILRIDAVAEEPAKEVSVPDSDLYDNILPSTSPIIQFREHSESPKMHVEHLYLKRRQGKNAADNRYDDPLCQLTENEKFRVSGLVFNSEYFADKMMFPAYYSVVEGYGCRKNKVSFQRDDVRAEIREAEYREWMFLCRVYYKDIGENFYFLSRGYNDSAENALSSNDVFLYQLDYDMESGNTRIVLLNAFTNIRLRINTNGGSRL